MALNKDDLDGLRDLRDKTDEFTSMVFDWVSPLKSQHLLQHLYDFKNKIEAAAREVEAQDNGDE